MIEFEAEERRALRYTRRKSFLRSIGLPDARVTNGRPDRPSNRPEKRSEYRRRAYLRKVAAENGISVATAEFLIPRRPKNGRRGNVARDEAGRFLPTKRPGTSPGERVCAHHE